MHVFPLLVLGIVVDTTKRTGTLINALSTVFHSLSGATKQRVTESEEESHSQSTLVPRQDTSRGNAAYQSVNGRYILFILKMNSTLLIQQ